MLLDGICGRFFVCACSLCQFAYWLGSYITYLSLSFSYKYRLYIFYFLCSKCVGRLRLIRVIGIQMYIVHNVNVSCPVTEPTSVIFAYTFTYLRTNVPYYSKGTSQFPHTIELRWNSKSLTRQSFLTYSQAHTQSLKYPVQNWMVTIQENRLK